MARCSECAYYDSANSLQRCSHPLIELNPFGYDDDDEIECDQFQAIAYSHESIVDMVVHEDIELFMFGGR